MISTIIIGCVLACLAGLAIVYIIRQKRKGNASAATYPPVGAVVPDAPAKAKTAIQQRKNPNENRLGKNAQAVF